MVWITSGGKTPFAARKRFETGGRIKKATASVCGLGQFIFYINGKKVGDHELDPGWTDYRKAVEVVEFDATDLLAPGKNVMAAEVGNGWYIMDDYHYTFKFPEFMPKNPNPYRPFGKYLILTGTIEIEYDDGSRQTVSFDEQSVVSESDVLRSNVYGSEKIDHRACPPDWMQTDFDDSAWKKADIASEDQVPAFSLTKQFQPPIKVIRCMEGKKVGHVNGRDIYDFSINGSAMLDVTLRGTAGKPVRFFPAEKLTKEGDADQVAKGWCTVDNVITFVPASNEEEHFRQKFTYFAGRYMAAEVPEGTEILSIHADMITSAWERDGSFHCDNEKYNRIYDLVEKAVEANMVSVHTDCPTIERFAWQEPNQLIAPSIMFMKNGSRLWEKFLWDMRNAQHTAEDTFKDFAGKDFYPGDGLMPSQCPCYIPNVLPVPGMGSFYDIIPWGSTCILGTRWHYRFYGDVKIIRDNYQAGMRYFHHLQTKVNEEGFINHGLGDWGNPDGQNARENVETAFLYADAAALAEFAEILGLQDDKAALLTYAEKVRDNYNEKLLFKGPDGWVYRDFEYQDKDVCTIACEALPLYFGMVPKDKEADVAAAFRKCLESTGALAAGEVALPYIIQTAAKYGMNDLIARYITKEEHPSYYAFVLEGETTLGEYWEENPRSHCHDMMGAIIEWYYRSIAGIEALEPGFKKVRIRPWLPDDVNEMSCTYHSVSGDISVRAWREEDGSVQVETQVADGIEEAK
ncbi:MAG: alpha-L-rhamnosidase N-terminal domain-containing protein [Eubacterium sp.]|nr:alpha-L-rhamnosidase N-terminal domain-containing protein [Eubacterium sp.]